MTYMPETWKKWYFRISSHIIALICLFFLFLWYLTRKHFIYLIGHKNPTDGFRPTATHPSRRLFLLCAHVYCSHQSMTGHLFADHHSKYTACRSILLHSNVMAKLAQPVSLKSSHSLLLDQMWKLSLTRTGLKILHRTHIWTFLRLPHECLIVSVTLQCQLK